ncbi:MAG: carbohydrate ABC transporter permease [Promethearchaeota archaeon]
MVNVEKQEMDKKQLTGVIISIALVVVFLSLTVLLPLLGLLGIFNDVYFLRFPSDNSRYFAHGIQLSTVFRTYDQMAGLTPILIDPDTGVATYLQNENAWLFLLMFIWFAPFIILGTGGAIFVVLPMVFFLLRKEPPRLLNPQIGIIIASVGICFQWILYAIYWFIRMADLPYFGGNLLLGLFFGYVALYFSQVIWKGERNWVWELNGSFGSFIFYMLVVAIIFYCVFPFFWALSLSLQNKAFQTGLVEYLPAHPTLENYTDIFDLYPFHENIFNSLVLASLTTVLCVLTGAFGGYVIARFEFTAKRVILAAILSMTMFPALVILVPLYLEYIYLNDAFGIKMLNTLPGILIPYLTFNLPLTLFLLQNFFEEIPSELIKAARVDGASNFQVFRKVILPLAIPGVFTTGILVFIAAWNEFLFASLLLTRENWTIPVVMASFEGIGRVAGFVPELLLSSATVIVTLPLIVLVLIFQRQIISGITAGAVKG